MENDFFAKEFGFRDCVNGPQKSVGILYLGRSELQSPSSNVFDIK